MGMRERDALIVTPASAVVRSGKVWENLRPELRSESPGAHSPGSSRSCQQAVTGQKGTRDGHVLLVATEAVRVYGQSPRPWRERSAYF